MPKVIYQSADEIDQRIKQLELDALQFQPDTDEHRRTMREIAKLRIYADAKRWLEGPRTQRAT